MVELQPDQAQTSEGPGGLSRCQVRCTQGAVPESCPDSSRVRDSGLTLPGILPSTLAPGQGGLAYIPHPHLSTGKASEEEKEG